MRLSRIVVPALFLALFAGAARAVPEAPVTGEHPNGTVVTVHEVVREADAVALKVSLANDGSQAVRLNQGASAALTDDRGNRYPLLPPAGNRELVVSPGSRIETTLRFQGALDPAAGAANLTMNEGVGGSASDADTDVPVMTLALSLPAASAGTVADGDDAVARLREALGAKETAKGLSITLGGDVLFDFDSAEVQPAAEPTLRQLAELIRMTEPKTVIVTGHTDSRGSDSYNIDLSLRRAVAVAFWLERVGGVGGTKFEKIGYGKKLPIAWNEHKDGRDNPEVRRQNRRVEVTLVAAEGTTRTQ